MAKTSSSVEDKPTILVTGGAGYIGSHVALAVLDAGYRAVVLDNLSTGSRALVDPRAGFFLGDTGDIDAVTGLMRRTNTVAVIHLAASISVEDSISQPLDYYHNNTCNTVALLQSCRAAGVSVFVFSSTAAVYGDSPQRRYSETSPPDPATPYGASKWMSERILADAAKAHGLRYCALRYFNVAGADPDSRAGQRGGATNLIAVALDAALGGRAELPVYGDDYDTPDGSGVRDYIHVSDLASAHVLVLRRLLAGEPVPEVLNCGYGRGHSVFEVIEAVGRATGRPPPWKLAPRRPGDLGEVIADNARIKALGWAPEHDSLDAMIADACNWELQGVHDRRRVEKPAAVSSEQSSV